MATQEQRAIDDTNQQGSIILHSHL